MKLDIYIADPKPQSPIRVSRLKTSSASKMTTNTTAATSDDEHERIIDPNHASIVSTSTNSQKPYNYFSMFANSLLSDIDQYSYMDQGTYLINLYSDFPPTYDNILNQHFTVMTPKCRSLLNRHKYCSHRTIKFNPIDSHSNIIDEEFSNTDFKPFSEEFYKPYNSNNSIIDPKSLRADVYLDRPIENLAIDSKSMDSPKLLPGQSSCIIPDKYRDKRMPYLVKKYQTGFLKFFDEKNNFGFMSLIDDHSYDVFVFGKEFLKSKIGHNAISMMKGNPTFEVKFRIMYYIGRHGPSRKAVNLRFNA